MHGSGKLAADALAVRGGAERQYAYSKPYPIRRRLPRAPAGWREGCAGRRRGCPGCGWRRPVRYGARGAGPWLRGLVARSRLAQGRPSRRGSAAGPARSRRPIRSVCSDRPGKGRERWYTLLTVSAGVMGGGTADQIIGDAPLVGVDPLDDTGRRSASSRRTWAST